MTQPDQSVTVNREDLSSILRARDLAAESVFGIRDKLRSMDQQILSLTSARSELAEQHSHLVTILTTLNDGVAQYECRL